MALLLLVVSLWQTLVVVVVGDVVVVYADVADVGVAVAGGVAVDEDDDGVVGVNVVVGGCLCGCCVRCC